MQLARWGSCRRRWWHYCDGDSPPYILPHKLLTHSLIHTFYPLTTQPFAVQSIHPPLRLDEASAAKAVAEGRATILEVQHSKQEEQVALLRSHIDEMLADRAAVDARNKELAQRAEGESTALAALQVTPLSCQPTYLPTTF